MEKPVHVLTPAAALGRRQWSLTMVTESITET